MFVRALCIAAAIAFAFATAVASAAEPFEVNPVRLALSPGAKSEDFSVTNEGAADITFSVRAYAWSQTPTEPLHLVDTDDVVIFPETFTVPPHGTQRVRVGVTSASGASERSYRIFVSQLPALGAAMRGVRLTIVTRVGIPLFVPADREGAVDRAIAGISQQRSSARVELRNAGSVHLDPSSLTVSLVAADNSTVWKKIEPVWYVLPGSDREVEVAIPPSACARGATVRATWASGGDATVERAWTPSSCGNR